MFTKLRTLYIFAVTITLSVIFSGCGDSLNFVTVDSFALGTFAQAKCKTSLSEQEILNIIKVVDEESKESMSIFSTTSLLSRINSNQTDSLDRHIAFNIELAHRFSKISNGAYDITIKPLTDAWGFGRESSETQINIDSLLEFVGYELISVSEGRVHKLDNRLQIDLNSIAKGYTVDLVAERFEELGITDYMVNIGGEIRCKGYNAHGDRWSIAIETPYDGNMAMDSYEKIVRIADKAVATSGNYRRFYLTEDGEKVVHTISPKTGYSVVSTLLSATVIAPTCAEADAAATMFMSLGSSNDVERIAEQCHKDYGWDYYLIFAGEEDYRIVCSEVLK